MFKYTETSLGTDFANLCQIRLKSGASRDGFSSAKAKKKRFNPFLTFLPPVANGLQRRMSFFDPRSASLAPRTGWSSPGTSQADLAASAVKDGTMS